MTSLASATLMPVAPAAVSARPESRAFSCHTEGSARPSDQTRARNSTGSVPLTRARTANARPGTIRRPRTRISRPTARLPPSGPEAKDREPDGTVMGDAHADTVPIPGGATSDDRRDRDTAAIGQSRDAKPKRHDGVAHGYTRYAHDRLDSGSLQDDASPASSVHDPARMAGRAVLATRNSSPAADPIQHKTSHVQ